MWDAFSSYMDLGELVAGNALFYAHRTRRRPNRKDLSCSSIAWLGKWFCDFQIARQNLASNLSYGHQALQHWVNHLANKATVSLDPFFPFPHPAFSMQTVISPPTRLNRTTSSALHNRLETQLPVPPRTKEVRAGQAMDPSGFVSEEMSFMERVEQQAMLHPNQSALVWQDSSASNPGLVTITYQVLQTQVHRTALFLKQQGVKPNDIVGVYATRSPELIYGILAILKCGACYVPLDPNYPQERIDYILADTKAETLLTNLPKERWPNHPRVIALNSSALAKEAAESDTVCFPSRKPHQLVYLIYTSGSTGKPKGIAMPERALDNLLQWQTKTFLGPRVSRTLQFASINFDVSFQEIFSTLTNGGTLVLVSEDQRRDLFGLLNLLSKAEIERLFLPFVALKHLCEAALRENIQLPALKEVITAGEQLQAASGIAEFFKAHPSAILINQYGPSESHVVTYYTLPRDPSTWHPLPPIGYPIANSSVVLLNDQLLPVGPGEEGELYIGGICLADGYLNKPEVTAEKFIPNPFPQVPGDRLYQTGDLGKWNADGSIQFCGRIDHQVKIRGHRVELGEIETLLAEFPDVNQGIVMALEQKGGEKEIVAFIKTQQPGTLDVAGIKAFLKGKLPEYCVPAQLVKIDKIPLSPNGKVDRLKLAEQLRNSPEPQPAVTEMNPPRTPLEMQIKLAFEKALNRPLTNIFQSFFEMGGDSLQALKLIMELENQIGKKVAMSLLYQASTVADLALYLQKEHVVPTTASLVPLQKAGTKAPLFLIHTTPGDVLGYGNLIFHLGSDQPCYGFQSVGLTTPSQRHTTVEGMAAFYIKELRTLQPHGPYYLGGWCYGGILAVEMAHQLQAAGEKVGCLLLMETPAPKPPLARPFYYLRRIGLLLQMGPKPLFDYLSRKGHYYLTRKKEDAKRFESIQQDDQRTPEQIQEYNSRMAILSLVYEANMSALNNYRFNGYNGKVYLFNAVEQDPSLIPDKYYGWRGLADDIEIFSVPGNHDTILMEPHVQKMATDIRTVLAMSH